MPEDTFKYRVELDTQGLAAQFAGVRDVVAGGLSQAAQGIGAAVDVVSGATNRLSSDLMMGQQMVAAAMPAQFSPMLPSMGIASTTLANVPGMPQNLSGELGAALGITRAPVGVFPSQFQGMARERLQERIQMGTQGIGAGIVGLGVSQLGGMAGGALASTMTGAAAGSIIPGIGTVVGGIAGYMLGDAAMAPVQDNIQSRMMERARLHQLFGFNKFDSEQRNTMSNFMQQQFTKSIFSADEFNSVLPAAARGGFFRGIRGGAGGAQDFQSRFSEAQESLTGAMFTMQLSGAEGVEQAGRMFQGFRQMGIRQPAAMRMMSQARVLAQDMAELGEFFNPMEVAQQQMEAGAMAAQFGIAPRVGAQVFNTQAAMTTRIMASGALGDDDLALLGGTAGSAAQRLSGALMQSQKRPLNRMFGLALGDVDGHGKVGVNKALLEQMTAGRMSIGDLAQKVSQQFGTGQDGMSKMAKLLANPNQIQAELLPHQGQIIKSFTEDAINKNGLNKDFQQLLMQNLFGVGEVESRAMMQGLPMERADQERLAGDAMKVDKDVKGAVATAQTGVAREFERSMRELKDSIAEPINNMSQTLSEKLAPSFKRAEEHLGNIEERLGGAQYRHNSPLSVGPIISGPNADQWMMPADPMTMQGFRAVTDSRRFPIPSIMNPMSSSKVPLMPTVSESKLTMAG